MDWIYKCSREKCILIYYMEYWKNLYVDMKCVWCMFVIEFVRWWWCFIIYYGNGYWICFKIDWK